MNYARLQQTQIPDLAPVYDGARGRTMSSRHQAYAWSALPPAIRGYRQKDGHTMDKLNRVLNALYATFLERDGSEPMPQLTFKDRKAIILKQSQV